jgi:hypothetical protein
METVFSVWFVHKCYKQGQLSSTDDSCQLEVEEIENVQLLDVRRIVTTWARDAENSLLLEAVARERLLKT